MINIQSMTIRNFMSYGNYDTTVDFSQLSQCFITGKIVDSTSESPTSNGSGKSSLMQAMLWILSGSTMHSQKPGDNIRNKWTDEDTYGELNFKDGSKLQRFRTKSGHTELLYSKDGDDVISNTLSTTANQQEALDKILKFDYDIFCGSVFLSQHRRKWLDMGEPSRKAIMERILGIDRLNFYADSAKKLSGKYATHKENVTSKVEYHTKLISDLNDQMFELRTQELGHNNVIGTKCTDKTIKINELTVEMESVVPCDIEALQTKWNLVGQINAAIAKMRSGAAEIDAEIKALEEELEGKISPKELENENIQESINEMARAHPGNRSYLDRKYDTNKTKLAQTFRDRRLGVQEPLKSLTKAVTELEADSRLAEARIAEWTAKGGEDCIECKQQISKEHAHKQISDLQEKLEADCIEIEKAKEQIQQIELQVAEIEKEHTAEQCILTAGYDKDISELDLKLKESTAVSQSRIKENLQAIDGIKAATKADVDRLKAKKQELLAKVTAAETKLAAATPEITIDMANVNAKKKEMNAAQIERLKAEIEALKAETNPYTNMVAQLEARQNNLKTELAAFEKEQANSETVSRHYGYIHKTYSDRRKIKSFLIGESLPFLNNQIRYYLDTFNLDIDIRFTDGLALQSDLWPPDYQSGGERARTELALTFANWNLHDSIHGQQCNTMVLDEPDYGLDESGVQALINIIKTDLSPRFDSIMVIAHRDSFSDAFPNSILIERENRLSRIADIR